jgi:nitrogen fixation NifU-like protein
LDSRFPDLDALYRDTILDHYRTPRGRKELENPDIENEGYNPLCGDEIKLSLKIEDGKIADVAVTGRGCSISVASGSMLAELLGGKTVDEALRITRHFKNLMHEERDDAEDLDMGDLDALEGVKQFPVRIKCALLPWTTLEDALEAHREGSDRPEKSSTTE